MEVSCLIRSLLLTFSALLAGVSTVKAQTTFSDNFIFFLEEARSQETPSLTLEASYQFAKTPNSNPIPSPTPSENSSPNSSAKPETQTQENLPKKEEPKAECSLKDSFVEPKTIAIGKIQVTGSRILNEDDLKPILASFTDQEPTPEKLEEAVDKITLLYLTIPSPKWSITETGQNPTTREKIRVLFSADGKS
ncbi:MAG: hypothetical protein KME64_00225 [Scytonematopsis contorta HA4267-MV1]|jgi:hemolysin activation/secretion protein|nr:hypothetical protein [Scytonematopsis contorta HA4267-MV1]